MKERKHAKFIGGNENKKKQKHPHTYTQKESNGSASVLSKIVGLM